MFTPHPPRAPAYNAPTPCVACSLQLATPRPSSGLGIDEVDEDGLPMADNSVGKPHRSSSTGSITELLGVKYVKHNVA